MQTTTRPQLAASSSGMFLPAIQEESWSRLLYVVEQQRRLAVVTGPAEVGKTRLLQGVCEQARSRDKFWIDATGLSESEVGLAFADACYGSADTEAVWHSLEDWFWGAATQQTHSLWIVDHVEQGAEVLLTPIRRLIRLLDQTRARATVLVVAREWSQLAGLDDLADLSSEVPAWDLMATDEYIADHRPATDRGVQFTSAAVQGVYDCTHGVAGRVRRLCDLCVLATQLREQHTVDVDFVLEVWSELLGPSPHAHSRSH